MLNLIHILNKKSSQYTAGVKIFYCGRGGALGNPFPVGPAMNRNQACSAFGNVSLNLFIKNASVEYLNKMLSSALVQPIGLECFCAPLKCHTHTIREYLYLLYLHQPEYGLTPLDLCHIGESESPWSDLSDHFMLSLRTSNSDIEVRCYSVVILSENSDSCTQSLGAEIARIRGIGNRIILTIGCVGPLTAEFMVAQGWRARDGQSGSGVAWDDLINQ